MICAPAFKEEEAYARPVVIVLWVEPSEKESGVALRVAMMRVFLWGSGTPEVEEAGKDQLLSVGGTAGMEVVEVGGGSG